MFSNKISIITACCVVAVFGSVIVFPSCKRNKNDNATPATEDTRYADEQVKIEQIYSNADRLIERALTLGSSALKGGENPLGNCAVVTIGNSDKSGFNKMTIDFGGSPCLGYDGRYRSGKLIVEYTRDIKMNEEGYYHKVTFYGYTLEKHRIGGYKEVANKGLNAAGNIYFNIASVDTVHLPDNSGMITGTSSRKREFYEGSGTPQTSDDVYRLTGMGHLVGVKGNKYYIEIAEPLVDALNCNWLRQGVINIFPEGYTQRVLNFGDGSCDDVATISVNGVEHEVHIP